MGSLEYGRTNARLALRVGVLEFDARPVLLRTLLAMIKRTSHSGPTSLYPCGTSFLREVLRSFSEISAVSVDTCMAP